MRFLKCLFRWCGGRVVSEWHTDGHLWVAWECATCGKITGAHQTRTTKL